MGIVGVIAGALLTSVAHAGSATTHNDRFTNQGSILNTRHNMTQSTAPAIVGAMDPYRNNYGEVCVYCHTPHGANNTIAAPLWNRTIKPTAYNTYNDLGTTSFMGEQAGIAMPPGPASLTCLSCHDGQTAIDSIINMPGSGMGKLSQETSQNTAFLDSWPPTGGGATKHMGLNSTNGVQGNGTGGSSACTAGSPGCVEVFPGAGFWYLPGQGCLSCHSDVGTGSGGGGGLVDFRMFNIGTDLRNDHPIGVDFPANNGAGTDWNTPANTQGTSLYFDSNGNGKMDKGDIRTYNGKVECASCHDPHGVPSGGIGTNTVFNKTFLRRQNTDGSQVCFTCHDK